MSSINHRSSARRRRKPTQAYHTTPTTTVEERLLQQAIENSKVDVHRPNVSASVPHGPTFFPTVEEFAGNPLHYIDKIRHIAERYGICKIVPPAGWNPPFSVDTESTKKIQTKEQLLYRLQEGVAFGDGDEYNPIEYQKMATENALKWQQEKYPHHNEQKLDINSSRDDSKKIPQHARSCTELPTRNPEMRTMTPESLECDYWDLVETDTEGMTVEYGNDIDTTEYWSGFPLSERGRSLANNANINSEKLNTPEPKFGSEDFYKETWWNLNNIPSCPESILRHVRVGINGINVPWLYFGSLFSTFCWHNEDNYLYSINYHHKGSPKQWYGVPGTRKDAEGLERVFKNCLSMKMRDVPDLLHHITTMFSPRLLQNSGVPVYKILQHPGEFIITFPRAFHSGFSMGPNVGEAVNFATHDWIAHGADANERYRSISRSAVFSHDRLSFTMANHLEEQQRSSNCILLMKELQRVVDEEILLRAKLISTGVRDVSGDINLPKNRLDQLDEESADYDDKRLCHACKHVCFFSAVGCECSHSKVSCLRHSHYMCRCAPEKKYLMIWSTQKDMMKTLSEVKNHCEKLKSSESSQDSEGNDVSSSSTYDYIHMSSEISSKELPTIATGVKREKELHKNFELNFSNDIFCKPTDVWSTSEVREIPSQDPSPTKKRKSCEMVHSLSDPQKGGLQNSNSECRSNELNDGVLFIKTCPSSEGSSLGVNKLQ